MSDVLKIWTVHRYMICSQWNTAGHTFVGALRQQIGVCWTRVTNLLLIITASQHEAH